MEGRSWLDEDPEGRRARTVRLLTCEANSVVKPIHPKAMSIILTEPEEIELRLTADWKDAKALQRRSLQRR